MADRTDIQAVEVHRSIRTYSQTGRPKFAVLAVGETLRRSAQPKARASWALHFPLGLRLPTPSPGSAATGVSFSSPSIKSNLPSCQFWACDAHSANGPKSQLR